MYLVIDIGGTKTEISTFLGQDIGSESNNKTFKTPQDYQKFIELLGENYLSLAKYNSISVSFPGIVSEGKIIQASNLPQYKNKELKFDIAKLFNTSVSITQDSTCSGIAEYLYGDLKKYNRSVHLILGTGLGGTFLQNYNNLVINPIEPCGLIVDVKEGRKHNFNKTQGLLEAYVGGGAVGSYYDINLADLSDNDDLWNEIVKYLAIGINNLNVLLKPEIVIIGGGIGVKRKNALSKIFEEVSKYDEFVSPTKVEFTKVSGNSSLYGALAINFVDNVEIL